MYGYAPALQYWTYEAIQQLATEFVVSSGNMVPRVLSWSHRRNKDFTKSVISPMLSKKNLIVLPMLKPRPTEKDYYLSLTEGDLPLYPGLGQDPSEADEEENVTFEKIAEIVSQAAEAAKIFDDATPREEVAGPTPPVAPASAPTPPSSTAPELADLIERLDRVEGRQETLLKNQSVILDVVSQILTFIKEKPRGSNEDSDSKSLDIPLDYVDDPTTPPTIIVTPDARTPGVVIINPEDVVGVRFQRTRRQRRKLDWFEDYTDPTRKRPRTDATAPEEEATQVLDHLKKPDHKQYRTMCKWLLGDIPNKTPRDVKTGNHGSAWFLTWKTPQSWLNDGHIDAAEHMLRMRRKYFPNIYRQNAVVMNMYFSQVIPARYDQYKKIADKTKYTWDSNVMSMLTGIEQQFMTSWGGVENVYWCQNYG
ncbi:uncharacterized protein LOC133791204 [Humulus lupulus]|uniref:uncharacterized protein LOC133791204 n=1 Tax=Humulus lupulus TaxID=3486 RepID=UPI002B4014EE|nr:uncharacterized protein LOC133791204 [Humulus lupulus]